MSVGDSGAFVVVGGQRLELERIAGGDGRPTLVFLHEGLGSVSAWRDFPRRLAAATGAPAVVYSRAGYGRSQPRARPWPLGFMHDEARGALPRLLEALAIDDAILVGHSDGGSIALVYAGEDGARVRGLVLEAPHVFVEDVCVRSIARLRDQYSDGALRARLARHHDDPDGVFGGWSDAWLDPEFRRWNLEPFLAGVRVPLLAIQGEDDEYGTPAQLDAISAQVSAPSEKLLLPACGHAPHRDRPDAVLAAMSAFVRRIST